MDVTLKFLGGLATSENLTGSCTAIEVRRGKKTTAFLIDAGLVQGDYRNFFRNNTKLLDSLNPKKIDNIIATHAHIDHIGLIPLMVNRGFKGGVICTKQSADLFPVMLADSYKVQRELAKRRGKRDAPDKPKRYRGEKNRNQKPKETNSLFTDKDVEKASNLIWQSGFDYNKPIKLSNEISLKLYPAGHILGSAICVIEIVDPQSDKILRLGFSGDLGRQEGILLSPPTVIEEPIDYWFTESTYGDRNHPERSEELVRFHELFADAKINGKKIIIPSFALQRTQEIIYLLTIAMHRGEIPAMPIYLDSPMAIKITEVFAKHWNLGTFNGKTTLDFNPFNEENPYLKTVKDPGESAQLKNKPGPLIVIASSGMCDAGRVRDHLRVGLPSRQTIVCLVGYMAPSSLGNKLKSGLKKIRMNDQEVIINAKIEAFESFSAHADKEELISYARKVVANNSNCLSPTIGILHGEETSGKALKESFDDEFRNHGIPVFIPNEKDSLKIKI